MTKLSDRKNAAEAALEEIATSRVEVTRGNAGHHPGPSAAARVKWIRNAHSKGIFAAPAARANPDSNRPGEKAPADKSGMNPRQIMAMGYTTSK